MKMTFVIPAHNEEDLIGRCLCSILKDAARTPLEDIEIIVVNNASTDRTREIAASFPGVRVVDEPRKGLVNARYAGFMAAHGELIANVDADTMLPPGWIAKVVKAFAKNPKLVALSGPHIFYDLSRGYNVLFRFFYRIVFAGYLLNRYVLRIGSVVQGGNFVVKRSAMERIGGFNSNFIFYGEDSDIARRLYRVGHVEFTLTLPIYASGRRILVEGVLIMVWRYSINYFWTIVFKRPFSKTYIDVRPKPEESRYDEIL